jgi:putative endonuclease
VSRQHQTSAIGVLGEDFVVCCLQQQGWTILHRRWRTRGGELDIIAQSRAPSEVKRGELANLPYVVFVEVKTRSHRNWDLDGRLAIAPSKQAKLWQAAELFLAAHPQLADYPCRFDVALVSYQRRSSHSCDNKILPAISQAAALEIAGYHFILHDYIQSAFGL